MVRHTHQDFLPRSIVKRLSHAFENIDLSGVKDFRDPPDLFDYAQGYYRKISISFLDEKIDDLEDWRRFINPLHGIDRLYLVNDRHISNPIMSAYAEAVNSRYLSKFKEDGISAAIV